MFSIYFDRFFRLREKKTEMILLEKINFELSKQDIYIYYYYI